MKLIDYLKRVLIESQKPKKLFYGRTNLIGRVKRGDKQIDIRTTKHQHVERGGELDPTSSENAYTVNKILTGGRGTGGVYNKWLEEIIDANFDQIFDEVKECKITNPDSQRVIFFAEYSSTDLIEFVAEYFFQDPNKLILLVITSGYSFTHNKKFFKNRENNCTAELDSNPKNYNYGDFGLTTESLQAEIINKIYLKNTI